MYLIGYCVGNIIGTYTPIFCLCIHLSQVLLTPLPLAGPQTFRPSDAPNYVLAKIIICVCYGLSIIDLLLIYFYCRRQNRKKSAILNDRGYIRMENQEWLDLTDRENPEFIYTL